MTRRIVTKTSSREEMLVRYVRGEGGWPEIVRPDREYSPDRISELWVPTEDTFVREGVRYYRLIIGHGDWIDIPIEEE